jgi:hypothetical protein
MRIRRHAFILGLLVFPDSCFYEYLLPTLFFLESSGHRVLVPTIVALLLFPRPCVREYLPHFTCR